MKPPSNMHRVYCRLVLCDTLRPSLMFAGQSYTSHSDGVGVLIGHPSHRLAVDGSSNRNRGPRILCNLLADGLRIKTVVRSGTVSFFVALRYGYADKTLERSIFS